MTLNFRCGVEKRLTDLASLFNAPIVFKAYQRELVCDSVKGNSVFFGMHKHLVSVERAMAVTLRHYAASFFVLA